MRQYLEWFIIAALFLGGFVVRVQSNKIKELRAEVEAKNLVIAQAEQAARGWEEIAEAVRAELDTRRAQDAAVRAQGEAAIARALEAEAELARQGASFRKRLAQASKQPQCEALLSADLKQVCGL